MSVVIQVRKTGRIFWAHASTVFDVVGREAVKDAAEELAERVKEFAPVGATGLLRRSIVVEHRSDGSYITAKAPYAPAVEGGRRAAGIPLSPLAAWFQKKLGLAQKPALVAALALSRLRRRQKGKHFFYAALQRYGPPIIDHYLGPAGAAIVQELNQS